MKNLSFRVFCFFSGIHFFCPLWFLCQTSETCHFPERASDFFLFFIYSFRFFPAKRWQLQRKARVARTRRFSVAHKFAFDWRLAHGPRPRRESASPGLERACMHARPLDCNVAMATEAKWMVLNECVLFPEHYSKFLARIGGWKFGKLFLMRWKKNRANWP